MISLVFLYCFCFQFHRFLLLLLFLSLGFIFFVSHFFYVKFFYGEIVEAVPPAGFRLSYTALALVSWKWVRFALLSLPSDLEISGLRLFFIAMRSVN